MRLTDIERMSEEEFKGLVLAAYERVSGGYRCLASAASPNCTIFVDACRRPASELVVTHGVWPDGGE